ncbi:ABC transporter permease [Gleimia sp. 6138-11-ORH1]|uniref:ABC transporter permease n=1 Tax=Gleimia sp. 6138-11-ORH1 TaxID=2973937 RepID=UPI00216A24AA|nr:ABC transporter permease [Gleimia sp. 6138-11-ORH1]MCS4484998.1 ABC transporter permease [Gleimia sp. 6138-11-ORH1]
MKPLQIAVSTLRRSRDKVTSTLTIIAIALPHAVLLAVISGVLMFQNRNAHPSNEFMETGPHLALAFFAATLLIIPALSMGAAASRLGLTRKARTLATLRLIGITPAIARGAAVIDTLYQTTLGIILGSFLYLGTLPIWTLISFQAEPISPSEMWMGILPLLLAGLGMLILTGFSALIAMQQVAITPLGVIRQNNVSRINKWSLILAAIFFGSWFILAPMTLQAGIAVGLTIIIFFLAGSIMLLNLLGVAAVTILGKIIARQAKSAEGVLAGRRLAANPKAVWRSFGALGFVSFIVGVTLPAFYSLYSISAKENVRPEELIILADISTGIILTMLISSVLAAMSTAMQQAIRALDSASQRKALEKMGAPRGYWLRSRRYEVGYPAVMIIGGATILGLAFSAPLMTVGNYLLAVAAVILCSALALLMVLTAAEIARLLERKTTI